MSGNSFPVDSTRVPNFSEVSWVMNSVQGQFVHSESTQRIEQPFACSPGGKERVETGVLGDHFSLQSRMYPLPPDGCCLGIGQD